MKDFIIHMLIIIVMCGLGFACGIDYAKEKGCGRFHGVYIDGHCLKRDVLVFPGGHP